jgi:hypothetical protein
MVMQKAPVVCFPLNTEIGYTDRAPKADTTGFGARQPATLTDQEDGAYATRQVHVMPHFSSREHITK